MRLRRLRDLMVAMLPLVFVLGGCQTPADDDEGEPLRDEDLKHHGVHWDDLTGQVPDDDAPSAPQAAVAPEMPKLPMPAWAAPAPSLASGGQGASPLDPQVKPKAEVAMGQLTAKLSSAESYEGGTLGNLGSNRVFVAPTAQITDPSRLYWVMVKVLSEKYSCFLTAKTSEGPHTRVTCRDGRQVVFVRSRGADWIGFRAQQYDAQGFPIMVRNHQIIRLSVSR